jgi:VWFA-related protein
VKAFAVVLTVLALPQVPAPTFRAGVERVQIDVSVMRAGRPVVGLTGRDFIVTDNGADQTVESVQLEDLPVSVQLVLDTSSSVSGSRLRHLIEAGEGLVDALKGGDQAGLITFSHAIDVRVPVTPDLAAVRRAIAGVTGDGSTSLRDALQLAIEIPPAEGTRLVVLVFTDGDDTTSWLSNAELIDSARRVGVVVHLVEVRGQSDATPELLKGIAEATGGRVWSASSERDLTRLFSSAIEEMRARYRLVFAPRQQSTPGWHSLRVRLRNGRADINARSGYFVN